MRWLKSKGRAAQANIIETQPCQNGGDPASIVQSGGAHETSSGERQFANETDIEQAGLSWREAVAVQANSSLLNRARPRSRGRGGHKKSLRELSSFFW